MKNNQSGRSMVEMLGVLAIIGVLSAGGLAGYSKAMFKHKLNSTMDQITMLVTNIRTMYGTQGSYAGLNNGTAVQLGIVPAVMGTSTGSTAALTNPFKGSVTIAPVSATGATTNDNTGFTVTYAGLPTEACIALSTTDFGSGAGSGFIGVVVGTTKTAEKVGDSGEGTALSMTNAITACNASGVKDKATIVWKFY